MFVRSLFTAGLALVLAAGVGAADTKVKSGPQVGEDLAGPFHPLNVNGKAAGQKHCLYCENGAAPVAMIFARNVNDPLVTLIKKLDEATEKNKDYSMGSFVVFLNDDKDLEAKLKQVAEKQALKKIVLSIDNEGGPKGYKVAAEADVTVVLYKERNVKANHAFKKGELNDKAVDAVVADLTKILPSR